MKLLSTSFKIDKSNKDKDWESKIMYLLPHKLSGKNLCPHASKGCINTCLNTAGRGKMNSVQRARYNRTELLNINKDSFLIILKQEMTSFIKYCRKKSKNPAIRLNGTSDLDFNKLFPTLFEEFKEIQFYDYTKSPKRMKQFLDGATPDNYHLTFSRSETNEKESISVLRKGGSVAVVFKDKPDKWMRFGCYDGDLTDLRFLDKKRFKGKVCSLSAKGKAKHDDTGFVI